MDYGKYFWGLLILMITLGAFWGIDEHGHFAVEETQVETIPLESVILGDANGSIKYYDNTTEGNPYLSYALKDYYYSTMDPDGIYLLASVVEKNETQVKGLIKEHPGLPSFRYYAVSEGPSGVPALIKYEGLIEGDRVIYSVNKTNKARPFCSTRIGLEPGKATVVYASNDIFRCVFDGVGIGLIAFVTILIITMPILALVEGVAEYAKRKTNEKTKTDEPEG